MSDITDVPLYQIIGAPLLALVQGETQAAQATARFIQEIGFESAYASYDLSVIENNPPDTGTSQVFVVKTGTEYGRVCIFDGSGRRVVDTGSSGFDSGSNLKVLLDDWEGNQATQTLSKRRELIEQLLQRLNQTLGIDPKSRLKVVTFRYSKTSVGGSVTQLEVEIPVLSIVAIPSLQIREAEIDFAVEINSLAEVDAPTIVSIPEVSGRDSSLAIKKDSSLKPEFVGFRAGLARQDSKSAMKINIKAGQADTPVGLLTIFRLLDQGISSREVKDT